MLTRRETYMIKKEVRKLDEKLKNLKKEIFFFDEMIATHSKEILLKQYAEIVNKINALSYRMPNYRIIPDRYKDYKYYKDYKEHFHSKTIVSLHDNECTESEIQKQVKKQKKLHGKETLVSFLYFMYDDEKKLLKIGRTQDLAKRYKQLKRTNKELHLCAFSSPIQQYQIAHLEADYIQFMKEILKIEPERGTNEWFRGFRKNTFKI